ncbi:MAG: HDOD domain-containing protein [Rubrivivax sp.]|nr:HDOD domain-containing protein [Rubrivivax sp.]
MSTPRTGDRLGRFELKRELGRGAQATVWLAHDALLQRDVALKLLDPACSDAAERDHWLHEARAVSALSHPHIVPVFEAVDAAGQAVGNGRPCLVFEYVEGPTLAQARRGRGAWPAREAVTLMLGVLDALAAAHAVGLVHRDLKRSNVLLGRDGRARVMDFGIAARVAGGGDGCIVGSPGYISPEAARGEAPAPAMDVFAAGVMLGELLAGEPLLKERDPMRALARVQAEDLSLPPAAGVDDALRGIAQRALARDPACRYADARALHDALAAWLAPEQAAGSADGVEGTHATLEFLLRRMRHKTDFPALSDAVLRIQRLATSETARLTSLADEVLNDVALTNKLLRMVNSVHFASAGSGQVATVSRAVALVGFAGIRNMAMAVLLLEHMKDKVQAGLLRQEFVRALTAGVLAAELEPRARESEEAFLGSMLQNLGRLLAEFYFPEEAERVRALAGPRAAGDVSADEAAEDAATRQVLGLTFDELGAGVARAWGLPEGLRKAMRRPAGEPPPRAVTDRVDRLRWLGRAANVLAEAVVAGHEEALPTALERFAARYAQPLGLTATQAREAARAAGEKVATLASAMGLAPATRPATAPPRLTAAAASQQPAGAIGTAPAGLAGAALGTLTQGRMEIERGLAERRLKFNDVLQLGLATLQQALACRAVVFCLRDAASGPSQAPPLRGAPRMRGRLAIGPLPADVFVVQPAASGDLLAVVTARAVDTLIADAATVAARMPPWWQQRVRAGTFLALPLALNGSPLGLIYADRAEAGSLKPTDTELAAVRSLRDVVVGALAGAVR